MPIFIACNNAQNAILKLMYYQLTEVPFSKIKMLKYTTIAFILLLMGVDMFIDSRTEQGFWFYFGQTFGIFSIIFFGPAFIVCLLLLVRSKKGLVFTDGGFKDYSCFGVGRFINWNEVENIERFELYGHLYIKVMIKEPQAFIASCSGITKLMYSLNYKLYGTPVFLSPFLLKSRFENLYSQVQIQWSTSK